MYSNLHLLQFSFQTQFSRNKIHWLGLRGRKRKEEKIIKPRENIRNLYVFFWYYKIVKITICFVIESLCLFCLYYWRLFFHSLSSTLPLSPPPLSLLVPSFCLNQSGAWHEFLFYPYLLNKFSSQIRLTDSWKRHNNVQMRLWRFYPP